MDQYEKYKLCDCLKIESFNPEDIIIKEGTEGEKFYMVIDGVLKAYKYSH